jgi:methionine aminopeptidase
MHVTIKTVEEQEKMRVAGRLAAEVLDMIGEHVVPGVTTDELDKLCHDYITITPPFRRRSIIAAFRNRSARRSTTSSVMASRANGGWTRAISSIST